MKYAIFLAAMLIFTGCQSLAGKPGKISPENMILKIYVEHKKGLDIGDKNILSQIFTSELANLLLREDECRERTREICNLEFDPIFATQDFDGNPKDLVVVKMSSGPSIYAVTFTDISRKTLIYEFIETPDGWRISNIIYPDKPSLKAILSVGL
jgi:hypothetical protein